MEAFELKYIKVNDTLYQEAIAIRVDQFFKGMTNSADLIDDDFESSGIHLVCKEDEKVVGTGRLNIQNKIGFISQMAISSEFQNKGIGTKLLNEFITYCKKEKLNKIILGARETALGFYEKFNFKAFDYKYPSKKTGIIHQQMVLNLE